MDAIRHALIVVMTLVPACASADGLIRTLPKDGAWVSYHGTLKGGSTEQSGKLILRSVGKVVENNQPLRWIELDMVDPTRDGGGRTIYKMLIAEKELKAGVDPVDHIVRAWIKQGKDDAKQIADPSTLDRGFVGLYLHGPVEKEKQLSPIREFLYQRGKLTGRARVGRRKINLKNLKGTLDSTVWPHKDVPFGVAGLQVIFGTEDNPKAIHVEFMVNDFGTDAKSALPDAN